MGACVLRAYLSRARLQLRRSRLGTERGRRIVRADASSNLDDLLGIATTKFWGAGKDKKGLRHAVRGAHSDNQHCRLVTVF
eukprot:6198976-Pleurochrysis_carterae.AAC.1